MNSRLCELWIGTEKSDVLSKATDVLNFMLVALNSNRKIPVTYILTNGITSEDKINLLNIF